MHRVAVFGEALCRHTANSRSPVFREYLAVVMVVLLSWAADAEAAKCMEITSTGRSHELLFHRGGCVTAHPQLMDSSSPAHPLPSPGLAQKPNQCQVWGGLIKTQQWGKDWQSQRRENMQREEQRCRGMHSFEEQGCVHRRASEAAGTSSIPLHATYPGIHGFCSPRTGACLFLPRLWQILLQ